jgi:hypothetical protein
MTKSKNISKLTSVTGFNKLKNSITQLESLPNHTTLGLKAKAKLCGTSSASYARIKSCATLAEYQKLIYVSHPYPRPHVAVGVPESSTVKVSEFIPFKSEFIPFKSEFIPLKNDSKQTEHLMNALNQTTEALLKNNKLLEELTTVLGMKKRWFS